MAVAYHNLLDLSKRNNMKALQLICAVNNSFTSRIPESQIDGLSIYHHIGGVVIKPEIRWISRAHIYQEHINIMVH